MEKTDSLLPSKEDEVVVNQSKRRQRRPLRCADLLFVAAIFLIIGTIWHYEIRHVVPGCKYTHSSPLSVEERAEKILKRNPLIGSISSE